MDKNISLKESIEKYISKVTVSKEDLQESIKIIIKEYYYQECEEINNMENKKKTPLYLGKRIRLPLFRDDDYVDNYDIVFQIIKL